MANSAAGSSTYRPEIDGLRALAVVAVIINHFDQRLLPSGYLGVDIFFVISGFFITASLTRAEAQPRPSGFLLEFYSRRIKRLLPALLVCVAVTSLFIALFDRHSAVSLTTGITALFGVSNIYLQSQATDYFARSTELNAFTHTWSLGVEEQFYLLFPLVILLYGSLVADRRSSRSLIWVIATLSGASLLAFIALSERDPSAAYFLMPTRFWELGAGGLLVLLLGSTRGARFFGRLSPLPALGLLLPLALLPREFQVVATISVVLLTTLLIATLRPGSRPQLWLATPWLVRLGVLSYSLYLWHWSVLAISRRTIGIQWWTIPIQIALILLLATLTLRYIETPLRQARWSIDQRITLGLGLLGAVLTALPLWALSSPLSGRAYLGDRTLVDGIRDGGPLQVRGTEINPPNCASDSKDATVLASAASFAAYAESCTGLPPAAAAGQPPQPAARHIFVVGDSHAMALSPLADRLFATGLYGITLFGRPGCPFPATRFGTTNPDCNRFLQLSQTYLLDQARAGDVVVVVGYWLSYLGDRSKLKDTRDSFVDSRGVPLNRGPAKASQYLEALEAFAAKASDRGLQTVLLGATPRNPDYDLCFQEWFSLQAVRNCERQVVRQLGHARAMNAVLKSRLSPRIRFVDPIPILCPGECDNASLSSLLRDTDHLSSVAVLALQDRFLALLEPSLDTSRPLTRPHP
ncbi:acyltransferase family protein [Synechococcus sp. EJ6-Ellesmere]|uniref:acyltransferase family protein n=1 Tax=Synechococcus sp. EJ6-Ellesmere TaxID=2823734 RepID=UPI0020CCA670|nr:acyltransferase family protein [Synechococcus sp. EJ6-Ellesmere]MCP9824002.1 acyltransferase [Synechococcus sp. EJ6-Ellesmere]